MLPLLSRFFRDPWLFATSFVALLFVILFTAKAIQIHDILGTSAYDLGIADQNIWLMSQFADPFNTIRGLNTHGDHFRPIEALFAPFYSLHPSIDWLFLFQSISVGAGAILIFKIGRQVGIASGSVLFFLAAGYLANPAVHNPLLWQYHSAVLATALYFGWILSYLRQNLRLFIGLLILLLSVREDMFVTTFAFGLILLFQRHYRYAAWTIILSLAWFFFVYFWLLPLTNGEGYFRLSQGSSSGLIDKALNIRFILKRFIVDSDVKTYLLQILSPVIFLPLAAPLTVAPALPSIIANSLIGAYNTNIDYHYNFNAIPFLYFATILVLARLSLVRNWLPYLAVFLIVLVSLHWTTEKSKMWRVNVASDFLRWTEYREVRDQLTRLNKTFGQDRGVAASDFLVPAFAHRKSIYLFPNPWRSHYWGIRGENPHSPNNVDFIVLDERSVSNYFPLLFHLVEQRYFEKTETTRHYTVYRRIRPEPENTTGEALQRSLQYLESWDYELSNVRLGPVFQTAVDDFDRLDIPIPNAEPQNWDPISATGSPVTDIDLVKLHGPHNYTTAYLYAYLSSSHQINALLSLGSDDGITVWHNGKLIWKNIARRRAVLGSDRVPIQVVSGDNHFYFRLNNATSTWRLLAFISPVSSGENKH